MAEISNTSQGLEGVTLDNREEIIAGALEVINSDRIDLITLFEELASYGDKPLLTTARREVAAKTREDGTIAGEQFEAFFKAKQQQEKGKAA